MFFTDVKVPVENRVGEENKGWTYAKYLLEFERGGNPYSPRLRSAFERLKRLSQAMPDGEESIMADVVVAREARAHGHRDLRPGDVRAGILFAAGVGPEPGPLSSMIKLRGTEVMQQVQESAVEAAATTASRSPSSAPGTPMSSRSGRKASTCWRRATSTAAR